VGFTGRVEEDNNGGSHASDAKDERDPNYLFCESGGVHGRIYINDKALLEKGKRMGLWRASENVNVLDLRAAAQGDVEMPLI